MSLYARGFVVSLRKDDSDDINKDVEKWAIGIYATWLVLV